jgi:hypothetical protein
MIKLELIDFLISGCALILEIAFASFCLSLALLPSTLAQDLTWLAYSWLMVDVIHH